MPILLLLISLLFCYTEITENVVNVPENTILIVSMPWRSSIEPLKSIGDELSRNKINIVYAIDEIYKDYIDNVDYNILILPSCITKDCFKNDEINDKEIEIDTTNLFNSYLCENNNDCNCNNDYNYNNIFKYNISNSSTLNNDELNLIELLGSYVYKIYYPFISLFYSYFLPYLPSHPILNSTSHLLVQSNAMYSTLVEFVDLYKPIMILSDIDAYAATFLSINYNISRIGVSTNRFETVDLAPRSKLSVNTLLENNYIPGFLRYLRKQSNINLLGEFVDKFSGSVCKSPEAAPFEFSSRYETKDSFFASTVSLVQKLLHSIDLQQNMPQQHSELLISSSLHEFENIKLFSPRIVLTGALLPLPRSSFINNLSKWLDSILLLQKQDNTKLIIVYFEEAYIISKSQVLAVLNGLVQRNHRVLWCLYESQRALLPDNLPFVVTLCYLSFIEPSEQYFVAPETSISDLLMHPSASLFVHFGSLSLTVASLYAGVPCLLLPRTFEHAEVAYRLRDYVLSIESDQIHKIIVAWSLYQLTSASISIKITNLARRMHSSFGMDTAMASIKVKYDLLIDPDCFNITSCIHPTLITNEEILPLYRFYNLDVYFIYFCIIAIILLFGKLFWLGIKLMWQLMKTEYTKSHI